MFNGKGVKALVSVYAEYGKKAKGMLPKLRGAALSPALPGQAYVSVRES